MPYLDEGLVKPGESWDTSTAWSIYTELHASDRRFSLYYQMIRIHSILLCWKCQCGGIRTNFIFAIAWSNLVTLGEKRE